MEDFSSCCASTTFANEISIASPFSSLEHAITVARDIWFCKLNARCWLEAISGRFCSNEFLETTNEVTIQALSVEYSGEIVNDTLDEAETDSKDNLDDISSGGMDISRQFELNKVPEEENETLYTQ
ncbi:hypothetical protein AHAS_Ahas15G0262700 [Arachis hypogaea]